MMKRFFRTLCMIVALAVFVSALGCRRGAHEAAVTNEAYGGLFDTNRVHKIEVTLSDKDWADLKADPLSKTKYCADVTIDGSKLSGVSFSTKGNTSLSSVAASDSDRYSFKINFGKFNKETDYFGLNKLHLNNIMSDATYMKDYLSYEIMRRAGVPAPFVSFTELYVNGSLHGLYIAVEGESDSFLERNFESSAGALYKPEPEHIQHGGQTEQNGEMPEGQGSFPPEGQGSFPPEGQGSFPPEGQGMPGMEEESGGADLKYADDDISSYPAVFNNEENKVGEDEERVLIEAVKALNEGRASEYWDTDELARYFAAHNFVLNYDSYTGNMLHNYLLYELCGKVSVLPWDYNLAFGGFMNMGSAEDAVNTAIDDPLSSASDEDRPLWAAIRNDPELLALYHKYYDELLKDFFESGDCEREIERIRVLIAPYVKNDPSAFYSEEEFEKAVGALKLFCSLRARSIRLQLEGTLSSDKAGRTENSALVDASGLDIGAMGSFGGGTNGGDMHGGPGGMTPPDGQGPGGMTPPDGQGPGGMTPPNGQGPGGMTPPNGQGPGGMTPPDGQGPGGTASPDGRDNDP